MYFCFVRYQCVVHVDVSLHYYPTSKNVANPVPIPAIDSTTMITILRGCRWINLKMVLESQQAATKLVVGPFKISLNCQYYKLKVPKLEAYILGVESAYVKELDFLTMFPIFQPRKNIPPTK